MCLPVGALSGTVVGLPQFTQTQNRHFVVRLRVELKAPTGKDRFSDSLLASARGIVVSQASGSANSWCGTCGGSLL